MAHLTLEQKLGQINIIFKNLKFNFNQAFLIKIFQIALQTYFIFDF